MNNYSIKNKDTINKIFLLNEWNNEIIKKNARGLTSWAMCTSLHIKFWMVNNFIDYGF